ncbi:MAG: hypothetical protein K9G13_04425 [Aquiluna sp.]|nr:hypothetical protein [Aquiluna sp.]MCF8545766.1 hypothetical protein [Aquiluna sp.]
MTKGDLRFRLGSFAGFNPWVLVFIGMALFHLWRQSLADVFIFGSGAILIMSQVMGLTKYGFRRQPQFGPIVIAVVVLVSASIMFLTPRHEGANLLLFLSLLPIGAALLLYVDDPIHPVPTKQELRGRLVWALWALVFALIELVAYLASKMSGDLSTYPTISVLLDPVLEEPIGRAIFIALWLMAGVYLFGVRRAR